MTFYPSQASLIGQASCPAPSPGWRHIKSTQTTAFKFSELWHPLRGTFKTSEDIEPAVEMLLDHYLILPVEDSTPGKVGRRGKRFIVNPKAMEVSDG